MAARGAFPIKVDSNLHGLVRVLKSAACEWLLLFLLLLDAAFSYFLSKFAQYCELQLPCILCSRLDHILGKEKPDFYVNLLCSNHKSEISSLVSCHNHGKLVDVHGMCEECLLSFAKNESSEETYKLLVGKLRSDCFQKPLVNLDSGSGSLTTKFCSCCSKPWRSRPNVLKLVQSKPPSAAVSNPEIPLPESAGHRYLNRQEGLKKKKDRFLVSTTPLVHGSTDFDSLSHVGYTEVKISSDSESDFPFSDDDDLITMPRNQKKDEFLSQQGSKFIPKSQYDDVFPAVQFQKSNPATSNLMFPYLEPEKGETTTPRFLLTNDDLRHGLGELDWQQFIKKASPIAPEIVPLDNIPLPSSAPESSPAISADEEDRVSLSKKLDASGFSDFTSHKIVSPSKNMQLPARPSREKCMETMENGDTGCTSAMNNWESIDLNSTSILSLRKDAAFVPSNHSSMGVRDLAPITIKDINASSLISEPPGRRACNGIGSAEESSVSKIADPETDSSSSVINLSVNGFTDEPQKIESPTSTDSTVPPKLRTCNDIGPAGRRACNGIGSAEESSVSKIADLETDSSSSVINHSVNGFTDEPQKIESPTSTASTVPPKLRACNDIGSAGRRACNGIGSAEESSVSKIADPETDSLSSVINLSVNGFTDEPQKIESPTSTDSTVPPKLPFMERSQSLDTLEESVSEIEGESLVDKLRRQVEYDKKCIKNLHQELEEERNAAAIAANQAMAMITKLQEEKAALNMEALQYLRMMEEQAEYDVDALEKANDMIAEKEREIRDLEAELDYFRIKYPEDFPEMNEEILFAEDAQELHVENVEVERS